MFTKQSGYALIELLIVLAIIIIFSGLSLAYYRNFDEQKKLDSDVKKLIDTLNLASKKTSSSDLSPNPNCSSFLGYRVTINSTTSYILEFNCADVYSTIQSYTLEPGITLTGTGTSILFKPLNSGTDLSNSVTPIMKNAAINKCTTIQVNPVGTVEEYPSVCL